MLSAESIMLFLAGSLRFVFVVDVRGSPKLTSHLSCYRPVCASGAEAPHVGVDQGRRLHRRAARVGWCRRRGGGTDAGAAHRAGGAANDHGGCRPTQCDVVVLVTAVATARPRRGLAGHRFKLGGYCVCSTGDH